MTQIHLPATELETDIGSLRKRALSEIRCRYESLVVLFDKPLERIQQTTTYVTKDELFTVLMSNISAIQDFACHIHLLTVAEVRALFEEYRLKRPDIFEKQP